MYSDKPTEFPKLKEPQEPNRFRPITSREVRVATKIDALSLSISNPRINKQSPEHGIIDSGHTKENYRVPTSLLEEVGHILSVFLYEYPMPIEINYPPDSDKKAQ